MKNAWYGHFYAQKLLYFGSKYQKTTVRVQVNPYLFIYLFIYFHKLLFEDIKLSDVECRNRKLSAHDCIYHIKALFSSDNYKTRNINRSHESNRLVARTSATTVPHYLQHMGTVEFHIHNILTVVQLQTKWQLGNVQLVLIIAVVEVHLQEDSFHF